MTGRILAVTLFIVALLSMPVLSGNPPEKSVKYAEVTASTVAIRKDISPESELVLAPRAGQTFEVIGEGKLWIEVKTENGNGWLPVTACRIVDRKTTSLLSNPASTIAFVGIIAAGLAVSIFFIVRRKEDEDAF